MPKHKQAGHTTVLTKYAQTPKKRLQCRSHPHTTFEQVRSILLRSMTAMRDQAAVQFFAFAGAASFRNRDTQIAAARLISPDRSLAGGVLVKT
jgi:hypothetical protein